MIQRADFIAAAKSMVDTPFLHCGRIVSVGLDCVGVLLASMAMCGLRKQEPPAYGKFPGSVLHGIDEYFARVASEQRQAGDVVAIMWKGEPRHLAIITDVCAGGDDVIVHAMARIGRVAMHHLRMPFQAHSHWCLREFA